MNEAGRRVETDLAHIGIDQMERIRKCNSESRVCTKSGQKSDYKSIRVSSALASFCRVLPWFYKKKSLFLLLYQFSMFFNISFGRPLCTYETICYCYRPPRRRICRRCYLMRPIVAPLPVVLPRPVATTTVVTTPAYPVYPPPPPYHYPYH